MPEDEINLSFVELMLLLRKWRLCIIMIAGDCLEVGKSYILKVGDNDIEVTASEAASEGGFQG